MTFLLQAFIPSDAASAMFQGEMTEQQAAEAIANMRAKYHLDKPFYVQFYYYVNNILRGIWVRRSSPDNRYPR